MSKYSSDKQMQKLFESFRNTMKGKEEEDLPQGDELDAALNPPMPSDELGRAAAMKELKAILGTEFAHLETEYDTELGAIVFFETGDNTYWSVRPPVGWTVEKTDIGAYDGDEQYIMYKDKA